MNDLQAIDVQKIAEYIGSKGEYQRVFTTIFQRIGENVQKELISRYTKMRVVDGRQVIRETLAEVAEFGANVPVDWIAFSFRGFYFWDLHVGVVFDTEEWPVTYTVGLHFRDNVGEGVQSVIKHIDWKTEVGLEPCYTFTKSVREHKYNDPAKRFDLSRPERQIDEIVGRAVTYYETAARVFLDSGL